MNDTERIDEDELEAKFWEFDTERKRSGNERDAFKHAMRSFTRLHLERADLQSNDE